MAEQQQKAEQKPQEKEPSLVERVSKEFSEVGNLALAAGAAGAAAGISYFLGGLEAAVNAALITASFPFGRIVVNYVSGKPITTAIIRNEAFAGLIFIPAVIGGVKAIQSAPKYFGLEGIITDIFGYSIPAAPLLVGALNFAVLTPALNAIFYPLINLFQGKRIFQDFGKNYLKGLIRTLPVNIGASIFLGASYAGLVAPYLLFPGIALANTAYYLFASPDLSYKKILASPYHLAKGTVKGVIDLVSSTATVTSKFLSNTYKIFYDSGLALGTIFKTSPPPKPA